VRLAWTLKSAGLLEVSDEARTPRVNVERAIPGHTGCPDLHWTSTSGPRPTKKRKNLRRSGNAGNCNRISQQGQQVGIKLLALA
jgi:hypothetical protein